MSRLLILMTVTIIGVVSSHVVRATDGAAFVVKESATDFDATVERVRTEIEKRGATIVTTVDHAAAAKASGLELRPTKVIIFGNPRLGTPLMQKEQKAGIDLPLRVLIWKDANGKVQIGYWPPSRITDALGIDDPGKVTDKMAAALNAITSAAAGQ
jgi:uncharacterized protein (DUF302 family)